MALVGCTQKMAAEAQLPASFQLKKNKTGRMKSVNQGSKPGSVWSMTLSSNCGTFGMPQSA